MASGNKSAAPRRGILGTKLGMTQVFDPETGAVTPVTVIQAGPCPVVQVRTKDADGYDAVQLAFDAVADRKTLLMSMPQNLQRASAQFRAAAGNA